MDEISMGGYDDTKNLLAQQVTRGGKSVYIVSLPIHLVPVHLAIPDPSKPIDSNRAVSKSHAESFGDYWLKQPDSWTVPPLLVDTASHLEFVLDIPIKNGPKIGTLKIPDYSNQILRTLDGQHRILGWAYIRTKLIKEKEQALNQLQQAKRSGTELEKQLAQTKLEDAQKNLDRMKLEQVTLEIITNVSDTEHKTFFVVIADNAQGINTSERARLDETNMTSRVAKKLIDNVSLLTGRVDDRKASAGKGSKDLMSLANLRDIVRHTCFGIKGKVTMVREQQIDDLNALEITSRFFQAMEDAVPALKQITNGTSVPKTLRQESLLGSITIWKTLAGSYNDLAVKMVDNKYLQWDQEGHKKFISMLSEVSKKMKITTAGGTKRIQGNWADTGIFNPGEISPQSRAQDLKALSALFTAWANSGTPFDPKRIER
jgi:hypothetical protein